MPFPPKKLLYTLSFSAIWFSSFAGALSLRFLRIAASLPDGEGLVAYGDSAFSDGVPLGGGEASVPCWAFWRSQEEEVGGRFGPGDFCFGGGLEGVYRVFCSMGFIYREMMFGCSFLIVLTVLNRVSVCLVVGFWRFLWVIVFFCFFCCFCWFCFAFG